MTAGTEDAMPNLRVCVVATVSTAAQGDRVRDVGKQEKLL